MPGLRIANTGGARHENEPHDRHVENGHVPATLAAGLSLASAASFARNDITYASPNGKTYNRTAPRVLRQTYGFAAQQTPQYLRFRDIYQSDSLGRQSFPNPDRDFDGPNTNNSF